MKQSRHFKHYIMDLVVVFVGISLAFMLDNWSGKRQEKRMLTEYYESLIIDVDADIATITSCITNLNRSVNSYTKMIGFNRYGSPIDSTINYLEYILGTEQFNASKSTYESLLGSGNINLISDVEIKKEMYRVYGLYDDVEFMDEVSYNYYLNTILPLLHQYTNMITFQGMDDLVSSNEFASVLVVGKSINQGQLEAFQELRDGLTDLSHAIHKEID